MGEKILVVDDDLESVKLIGLMLQRRGYEITAAQSGDQALEKAEAEQPDLVILDVMMPHMDGYQVCRQLRSNPKTAHLPVLMFTAKTLVGDKVAGFQSGADDYLTKPIHPAELVSRVESLLRRMDAVQADVERLPRTRVVGVMGAKGGVGASTLVVNLAMAASQNQDLAREHEDSVRVSIADLRVGLGSVAVMLGDMPQGGLATLLDRNPDSLDQQVVGDQIVTHPSGLHYLPAALQPESGQGYLPETHVKVVLSHMMTGFDYLFLDLGSVLDEAARYAISQCNVVVIVVEPDPLCLTLARALLDEIESSDSPPSDLRVVMVERAATDAAYTQAQVESRLERKLAGVIGFAPDPVRQAIEQGQPVVSIQPESEIATELRDLSRKLLT